MKTWQEIFSQWQNGNRSFAVAQVAELSRAELMLFVIEASEDLTTGARAEMIEMLRQAGERLDPNAY